MVVPDALPDDPVGYLDTLVAMADQIAPVLQEEGHIDAVRAVEHLTAAQPGVSEADRIAGLCAFGIEAVDIRDTDPASNGDAAKTARTYRVADAVGFLEARGLSL